MSDGRGAALPFAATAAIFGATAGGAFAAAEIAAMAFAPTFGAAKTEATSIALSGAALLAFTWIGLGAGATVLLAIPLRERVASLSAFALIPVVLASLGHSIAFSIPQPRLAVVLAGGALVLGLAIAAASSPERAMRLRFAANPWAASALLVGLSVLELDLLRRAPVWQQLLAALGLAAGVLSIAWARARLGRGPALPDASRGLALMLVVVGISLGATRQASRPSLTGLPVPNPSSSLPPIVLVTLDTVRSDHLSVYGYERQTSPRIDAFSRGATLYRRAIASSDMTLSTHASLFTGLYPRQHGARVHANAGARSIAPSHPVLAEILRERGYLTLAVVANPDYLAKRYGFDRGFDHYDDRRPPPPLPDPGRAFVSRSIVRGLKWIGIGDDPFARAETAYRQAGRINRAVVGLLDAAEVEDAPFFLFVNYMDAHWPYDPPPPFDRRFPGRMENEQEWPDSEAFRAARLLERPLTRSERAHLVSQYDGGIAYLDAQLGALLDLLDERGLLDPSLVVITADHGEAFGEHGLFAHGVSVYQDQLHVPLLVKLPGQRDGRVSDRWASSVDLLPTVLELIGEDRGDSLPGESWLADLPRERVVIAESYPDTVLFQANPRFRRVQRAIFSGDHKLVVPEPGRPELYDLARDPKEQQPASAATPPGRELASALDAWLRGGQAAEGDRVPVDETTVERLRALGYVR